MENNQYVTKTILLDTFTTINKVIFEHPEACYTLYGNLENGNKLALIFHGFSSNTEVHLWWRKFSLKNLLKNYNVLCINSLGSCHGSLGPHSINPTTNTPYLEKFPQIQIQDTVNFAIAVLKQLGITSLDLILGCSLGGMQVLDMFIRYPVYSKKCISVCGSPLPLTTKLMNAAQSNILEKGIKQSAKEKILRSQMGLARLFFRLSCTSEKALSLLVKNQKHKRHKSQSDVLEEYFISDGQEYENIFSPYSYYLYIRMLMNFEIASSLVNERNNNNILLVGITGDQFTPPESILQVYNLLKVNKLLVRQKTFETPFGHEAWILDGENFYEFIKDEFVS